MLFCNIDILDEDFEYQKDVFVGVENDKIAYIGKEEPQDAAKYGERYNGKGKLLIPAFYNTHAHTSMTFLRGYAENQPLQQWLNETVWPFEGHIQTEDNYWGCMLAQAEMLRYGIVSYTDMYSGTIYRAKATLEAGMKANHCDGGTMCFVDTDYDTLPVAETNRELFANYHGAGDGRLLIDMCVHAEYTTPQSMIERCVEEVKNNNSRLHIHMSETKSEHEECIERHNMTPAKWFDSLGAFDIPIIAAHCVWVDDDDIALMAQKGVNVSLNPASNCKLASGFAPVEKMIKAGVNCTIGTDGMASNNTHNILQSAYLLACCQKGNELDPTIIDPKALMKMMTINGAKSQGRDDCGLIKEGMKADLIVMDVDNPWMKPVHNMLVNLIYSANAADIVLTMCDGKVLYKDGEYLTIDIEKTTFECEKIVDGILDKLAKGEEQGAKIYRFL